MKNLWRFNCCQEQNNTWFLQNSALIKILQFILGFFFSSLVIECSHCPRATGTYSDPFCCLERHFISAICRKTFLMWIRPNTKPLPFLIKCSTLAKCSSNISPLWLSSLLLYRSSKTRSPVSFQYIPVVGISLFLSYFTYPVQKVLPPCSNIPTLPACNGEEEIFLKETFSACRVFKSSPVIRGLSHAQHTGFWNCSLWLCG